MLTEGAFLTECPLPVSLFLNLTFNRCHTDVGSVTQKFTIKTKNEKFTTSNIGDF